MDSAGASQQAISRTPPVVAVMVTHDPGPWFDEVLSCLDGQDYPDLSVLVIDAASEVDPHARIARLMPSAYVRRLEENPGYPAAANTAHGMVEGAAYYLFLHDDVALGRHAVTALVEEAVRSDAGVVGPKLVRWDQPHELLQVGMGADKVGAPAPYVDRGELDQEQHDAVRDVFYVPGACTLVRSDLLATLGGFDPGIEYLGEDLDLCWRAQVAGARVLVAPGARVRHLEALGDRRPVDDRRRLQARHRLRTMLSCYGLFHLVRVLPQAMVLAAMEVVYAVATGRLSHARDVTGAWTWNLRRTRDLRARRKSVRAIREVHDGDIRQMQVRGSSRLRRFLQREHVAEDTVGPFAGAGRQLTELVRTGPNQTSLVVWAAVIAFLAIGSRHLLSGSIPAVGHLGAFPSDPVVLLREWASGWRSAGLGASGAAPTAYGLLGGAGLVFLGAMGVLRHVLILGLLPLGAFGAWKLAAPLGSRWARAAVLVTYVAVPVPYNALATGRWGGLAAYAAAPWIIGRLARVSLTAPFGPSGGAAGPSVRPQSLTHHVLALVLLAALLAALVPAAILIVPVVALALALGAVLAGPTAGTGRVVVAAVGAVVGAVVLHMPWSLDLLSLDVEWATFAGVGSQADQPTLSELIRFETGPILTGPVGYGFVVAAALPLLVGSGWRFGWAVRAWSISVASWAILWAAGLGVFGVDAREPEILLAPAAVGVALAIGLGVAAFQVDVAGRGLGWRQAAALVAGGAVFAAMLPALAATGDGAWHQPRSDLRRTLSFLDEDVDGSFRVLWLGDPDVVPVGGWALSDKVAEGVVYGTTLDSGPEVQDLWVGSSAGATRLLRDAVQAAITGDTARVGSILAPMGVRYIVVPEQLAPAPFGGLSRPVPSLIDSLQAQLDLARIESNPAVTVFRNDAWVSTRSLLPDDEVEVAGADRRGILTAHLATDLAEEPAVLPEHSGYTTYSGPVDGGETVFWSAAASDRWTLEVDGIQAPREVAFGWANAYPVGSDGQATLSYGTPLVDRGLLGLQVVLWALAVVLFARTRAGSRR